MHNLGVPEALQSGPKTAAELAALVGPDTNPEWLARVLKYAAEHGLVSNDQPGSEFQGRNGNTKPHE